MAENVVAPIVSPLSTLAIVFIIAIFVLLQRQDLRDRLIRLFGTRDLHRTTVAMDDAADRLSRYFLTQLAINAAFGAIIGSGLLIIGVPSPALWAGLSTLLRFVPYVGALLSAVLPMALAAAVDPGWTMLIWTAVLFIAVEGITGQAIEPLLYGHRYWPHAGFGRGCSNFLDLNMGPDWPHSVDPAHPLSRRARPAYRSTTSSSTCC